MTARKLTQGKVLRAMHGGAKIIKTISNLGSKTGAHYVLTTGGDVPHALVAELTAAGLIRGCGDDLFGDPQSYEIARNL